MLWCWSIIALLGSGVFCCRFGLRSGAFAVIGGLIKAWYGWLMRYAPLAAMWIFLFSRRKLGSIPDVDKKDKRLVP